MPVEGTASPQMNGYVMRFHERSLGLLPPNLPPTFQRTDTVSIYNLSAKKPG